MSNLSLASQLSPALVSDLEMVIARSIRTRQPSFAFIEADEELDVCEFLLHYYSADIDGDSEMDGPDTIRCNGKGWTLVLKVN